MKNIKPFQEYVQEGIVKKQHPDLARSKSLLKESRASYDVLLQLVKKVGVNETTSNTIIKLSYDALMECIRASMCSKGFHSSGQGAHEAEVAYLKELAMQEHHVAFANQLRYFRNGILYYGKSFDPDYAHKVVRFLQEMYRKLSKL
jgi:hypothetical protein